MGQLIGCLILVGLVAAFWKWILLIVVIVLVVKAAPAAWQEHQAELARRAGLAAAMAARADQQHAWWMSGDPRGTYG